jgi:hypothetical protein
MDWHKLQNTLFELDPTDPREDFAKMQQAAQGGATSGDVPPTKDYLNESVEVTEGSMPLGLDSISDFAALAGVVTEGKQHTGSAGQLKGKDKLPTLPAGTTKNATKDKLVGENEDDRVAQLEARVAYLEGVIESLVEAKPKMPKPSNPVAKHMNTYNKASVVPDKKKDVKAGKTKHKGKQYDESNIKDTLWARLNELSKS